MLLIKPTRCTNFSQIYFWNKDLYVSDSSSVNRQDFFHCTNSNAELCGYFLPDSRTETKIENTNNIGVNSFRLWPWINKITSPHIQINIYSNVPLQWGSSVMRKFNISTPNVNYSWSTALLSSKVSFYIFIRQIYLPNILNTVYTLPFFLFQIQFVL